MPNFVNPTNEIRVFDKLQAEDGSTLVVGPGETVNLDQDEYGDWPKETKSKEPKPKTEESKK